MSCSIAHLYLQAFPSTLVVPNDAHLLTQICQGGRLRSFLFVHEISGHSKKAVAWCGWLPRALPRRAGARGRGRHLLLPSGSATRSLQETSGCASVSPSPKALLNHSALQGL